MQPATNLLQFNRAQKHFMIVSDDKRNAGNLQLQHPESRLLSTTPVE